ncbi:MAG: aryl-sulfate sulfotransferase [bacterium]|nr:MAG: aryl-sulfate sulfotransferase [bacterium]
MSLTKSLMIILTVLIAGLILHGKELNENNLNNKSNNFSDGYTLFAPTGSRDTYLIDMNGKTVHEWSHNRSGGYSVYLLENGNILRTAQASNRVFDGGGSQGYVQEVDWDDNLVWEFEYSSSTYLAHHDIEPMPNDNVLIIAWELKSASEASAAGRKNSSTIWPDHVIEVDKSSSQIVWEWHAWDHLVQDYDPTKANYGVVADHPELIDVNLSANGGGPRGGGDWLHMNGISYNPTLDHIIISSHYTNEIYIIDHSTTAEEAKGHTGGKSGKGGDILYRWGKPANYDASGTQYFSVIHSPFWIPYDYPGGGNILVFNNGTDQRESSIIEIIPPIQADGRYTFTSGSGYGPNQPAWLYSNGRSFYSSHQGGCQRLANGNTLITDPDNGYLFEVNQAKQKVWEYGYGDQIARSIRYSPDYKGLSKLLGTGVNRKKIATELPTEFALEQNFPNPFNAATTIQFSLPKTTTVTLTVYNELGEKVATLVKNQINNAGTHSSLLDATGLSTGIYFYRLETNEFVQVKKMILLQ